MRLTSVTSSDEKPQRTAKQGSFTRTPLRTNQEVRREIARLYLSARRGELDVGDASKLANILSILGRLINSDQTEERLASLEDLIVGSGMAAKVVEVEAKIE